MGDSRSVSATSQHLTRNGQTVGDYAADAAGVHGTVGGDEGQGD